MTQMIVYEFTDTLLIPERSFACLPALRDRKAMSVDDSGLHPGMDLRVGLVGLGPGPSHFGAPTKSILLRFYIKCL